MDKHDEFKSLLLNIKYDNFCDDDTAISKLEVLRNWIKTNLPQKLFWYRAYKPYSIDALRKDEIWGSMVSEDNDPYEYIPCYDLNKVDEMFRREFDGDVVKNHILDIKAGNISPQLKALLGGATLEQLIRRVKATTDDNFILKNLDLLKSEFMKLLAQQFHNILNDFFVGVAAREMPFNVACFSEDNTSSLMWGHYADGHKGFCLEYNFSEILMDCNKSCPEIKTCNKFMLSTPIAPICYSDNRFDATDEMLSIIQQFLTRQGNIDMKYYYADMLLILKCLLTKSNDWRYEKEWRLFNYYPHDIRPHRPIIKLKPKAIYLGNHMTKEHKDELLSIAKEKEIPCYQVIPQFTSSEFAYSPFLIFDGKQLII